MTAEVLMLDEIASRRPEFLGGQPIVLADGRAWAFPDGPASLGPDFDRLVGSLDEVWAARQAGGPDDAGPRPLDIMMTIAARMLRANYRLDDSSLTSLLRFRAGDESAIQRWASIVQASRRVSRGPETTCPIS